MDKIRNQKHKGSYIKALKERKCGNAHVYTCVQRMDDKRKTRIWTIQGRSG